MSNNSKSHLLDLHTELQLEIISYVKLSPTWQRDLMKWSSVSSHFRLLLAPHVFSSITLRNTEKSASSIDLIAKFNNNQYVRELIFLGSAPGDEEDGFSDVDGIFPPMVDTVLSNLNRFPGLQKVTIDFDIDFYEGWDAGFSIFQDSEWPEERVKFEQEEAWRALNTKVYAALAKNLTPGFKKLKIANLLPAEASSFNTTKFHQFLGKMTHFDPTLWGDRTGDYAANTRLGYVDYTLKFDVLFFNHLTSLTHLTICADRLPMGLYGFRHAALQLHPSQMPILRSLTLNTIFICPELRDFLASHAQTLKIILLEDCHAGTQSSDAPPISWAELFNALAEARPRKLRRLAILSDDNLKLFDDYHSSDMERAEGLLALETLKTHPERRTFAYSYIDDKYGFVGDAPDDNLASFRLGDDQRAFDELMQIVETNCEET